MFEKAVLDYSRRPRSKWSWMGVVIQAGIVSGILLVPMVSPEVLSVMLPKTTIYVPSREPAPVEVEVQASSAQPNTRSAVVTARPAYKPFTAPSSYTNPVNTIIDGADFAPPLFAIGDGKAMAGSAPFLGSATGIAVVPPAPPPKTEPPARKEAPHRVGGHVQAANILTRVNPVYPPLARQARIAGPVRLEGTIAKDGTVQQLKVISGHPLLVPAAVEAVKQWRYRPTRLNGEPVEVIAPIEVNFILSN